MKNIIWGYIFFGITISCNNVNTVQNITTKQIKVDSMGINIETLSVIPDDMIGCGCIFYLNSYDKQKEHFFFLDNGNSAIIKVNKKIEKLDLLKFDTINHKYFYSNSNFEIQYKIFKSDSISNESSEVKGEIIINNKDIKKEKIIKFIGTCGC